MKYPPLVEQRNDEARKYVLDHASRKSCVLFHEHFASDVKVHVRNVGLITHFTLEGEYAGVERVQIADFNFYDRIRGPLSSFPCHYNKVLLPIASVFFNPWHPDDWMIPDLRGAIYAAVVNASCYFQLYGKSEGLIVRQHYLDDIPSRDGRLILPILDLAVRNGIL